SHDLVRLIDQKGLVPEEVYSGLINGQSSHDHSELENGLKGFLDGVRKSTVLSQNWKTAFSSILDSYIGSVSEQFTYNEKPYTPQTFAEQLNLNTDSYKTITSFTHHPFYENFILEIPDNYSNGTYFNMPLDELMSTLDFAILAGYTVVWDGDVSEKGFSASNGIAILPIDNSTDDLFAAPREERKVTQENRQISFENYRTTDDHLMHIIGIATDQKGTKFYLTKNSWGERGEYSGYLYMSEAYVKMKTVALMLHKDGMPDDVRKKLKESK
ncbi:MAG: C1 family peptidase, partial [Saprospiraceae bacterium]